MSPIDKGRFVPPGMSLGRELDLEQARGFEIGRRRYNPPSGSLETLSARSATTAVRRANDARTLPALWAAVGAKPVCSVEGR